MASARVVSRVTSRIEGLDEAASGIAVWSGAQAAATTAAATDRTSARRLGCALATGLLEQTRLRHQLLDRRRFDRREAGEVLVPGRRDEDDVLEPDVDAVVGDRHRRLDREDHPG